MAKKILIVEDEADILRVVEFRLRKLNYEIFSAVNGKEALELIRKIRPDLIFLDILLPVMDGYEVIRILKNDKELKSIPVVFLTASVANIKEKAKEFNADDYLVKPFEPEEIIEKVKKFLG